MKKITPPTFGASAFNCPFCHAYSNQTWGNIFSTHTQWLTSIYISSCVHCSKHSIWVDKQMVFPQVILVPSPNDDLSKEIRDIYLEASNILNTSPRGASALLRLCIQKICIDLGEKGKSINDDIQSLVKKGLNPTIQQALDVVRVVGNNAVHPGQLDMKDNIEVATKLFTLINIIADVMITTPKHIAHTYESLVPLNLQDEIKKRDGK